MASADPKGPDQIASTFSRSVDKPARFDTSSVRKRHSESTWNQSRESESSKRCALDLIQNMETRLLLDEHDGVRHPPKLKGLIRRLINPRIIRKSLKSRIMSLVVGDPKDDRARRLREFLV